MSEPSVFIENAQKEAAEEEVFPGDPQADELLRQARRHIYHWPTAFKGFAAEMTFTIDGQVHRGRLNAPEGIQIEAHWEESFDNRWVRFQLEELLSHRTAPEKSKIASKTGCQMDDLDPIYGQKIVFVGDKMSSFYRIKDSKIAQIGRSYGKLEFIINIDAHHNLGAEERPAYAAADYTAFYWNKANGNLVKTETYRDHYILLDGLYLPQARRVSIAQDSKEQQLSVRRLEFHNHTLLG